MLLYVAFETMHLWLENLDLRSSELAFIYYLLSSRRSKISDAGKMSSSVQIVLKSGSNIPMFIKRGRSSTLARIIFFLRRFSPRERTLSTSLSCSVRATSTMHSVNSTWTPPKISKKAGTLPVLSHMKRCYIASRAALTSPCSSVIPTVVHAVGTGFTFKYYSELVMIELDASVLRFCERLWLPLEQLVRPCEGYFDWGFRERQGIIIQEREQFFYLLIIHSFHVS